MAQRGTQQLALVLNPDLPDDVIIRLLQRKFKIFEVELDDVKYSAVLFGYKGPQEGIERTGDDLLAVSQIMPLEGISVERFTITPVPGLLLEAGLPDWGLKYFQQTFLVDEVEKDGEMRHVLRIAWIEIFYRQEE